MRIMIVTDQYPPMVGGVPTVTHGLAHDFANRGHQVWVVAPSQGPRDERRIEQKVRVYYFSSFDWPMYEGMRIPFLPFIPIRNLLKKCDPHISHSLARCAGQYCADAGGWITQTCHRDESLPAHQ